MELEQAIRTRRTHKAFASDPVDASVLDELFELARWAPNHHVTNPWRFRVLGERSRERLMELAEATQPGTAVKLRRAPLLDDPRGREIVGLPAGETPVGLLYLGTPVQEQRVPERTPPAQFVTYLD